jgi:hypothetical protein
MGSVDELALVVVGRAFFLSSVDLGVGGIEVDRRALFDECCATLGWQHREHTRDELHVGLFHMSACRGIEALAQSDHRRRRRHTGHSAQSETGSVLSLVVEVAEEVTTGEHHLGECDHQPAEHEPRLRFLIGGPLSSIVSVIPSSLSSLATRRRPARGVIRPSDAPSTTLRLFFDMLLTRQVPFVRDHGGLLQPPFSQVKGTLSRIERVFAAAYSRIWLRSAVISSASAVSVAATKRRDTADLEVERLFASTVAPTGSRPAP